MVCQAWSLVTNKLKFRTSLGSGNYVRDSSLVRKLFANNVCNVYAVQICDAELSQIMHLRFLRCGIGRAAHCQRSTNLKLSLIQVPYVAAPTG